MLPAERRNVAIEDFGDGGEICGQGFGVGCERGTFTGDRRDVVRVLGAAVAGVAGDLAARVEGALVEGQRHAHHGTRGLFGLLVVLIEVIFYMTKRAVHTQG